MAEEPTITLTLLECPIGALTGDEERYAYYLKAMPLVLGAYSQISVDGYWRLTVAEHNTLYRGVNPDG